MKITVNASLAFKRAVEHQGDVVITLDVSEDKKFIRYGFTFVPASEPTTLEAAPCEPESN